MIHFDIDPLPRERGVYIVGGALRDHLLGRTPMDIDIVVQGDPEPLARDMARKLSSHVISMGRRSHPMFRVATRNRIFDISPLQGISIQEDLRRRDFTINALAYETFSANLIDVAHGLQDIQGKRVRQVSEACFQADPLRLLRAFRIAAQLGFQIEKETLGTIRDNAHRVSEAAGERIRSELLGLLKAPDTHEWLRKMASTGILFYVLPEMAAMKGCLQNRHHVFDVFDHTIHAIHQLEALISEDPNRRPEYRTLLEPMDAHRRTRLKLAALLHDIGKPLNRHQDTDDQVSFSGHESTGADMVTNIGKRLRFSRNEIGHAVQMVLYHLGPLRLLTARHEKILTQRDITRFFMKTQGVTADILLFSIADMRAEQILDHEMDPEFELFVTGLARSHDVHLRSSLENPPLLSGHDLINHLHLTPSPLFKRLLARAREYQLAGLITTKKDALKLAADLSRHVS